MSPETQGQSPQRFEEESLLCPSSVTATLQLLPWGQNPSLGLQEARKQSSERVFHAGHEWPCHCSLVEGGPVDSQPVAAVTLTQLQWFKTIQIFLCYSSRGQNPEISFPGLTSGCWVTLLEALGENRPCLCSPSHHTTPAGCGSSHCSLGPSCLPHRILTITSRAHLDDSGQPFHLKIFALVYLQSPFCHVR